MLSKTMITLGLPFVLYALQFAHCFKSTASTSSSSGSQGATASSLSHTGNPHASGAEFKFPADSTDYKQAKRLPFLHQNIKPQTIAIVGSRVPRFQYAVGDGGVYVPVRGFRAEFTGFPELRNSGRLCLSNAGEIPDLLSFERRPEYELYITNSLIAVRHFNRPNGDELFMFENTVSTVNSLNIIQTTASGLVLYLADRVAQSHLLVLCDLKNAQDVHIPVSRPMVGMNTEGTFMAHEHGLGFKVYSIHRGECKFTIKEKAYVAHRDHLSPLVHSIVFLSERLIAIERVNCFSFYRINASDDSVVHLPQDELLYPHLIWKQQFIESAGMYLVVGEYNKESLLRTLYRGVPALFVNFKALELDALLRNCIKVSPSGSYLIANSEGRKELKLVRLLHGDQPSSD